MQVIRQDNPGMDQERMVCPGACDGAPQYVDMLGKQGIVMALQQIDREKPCPARSPDATIIWHPVSIVGGNMRRNSRCSLTPYELGQGYADWAVRGKSSIAL